MNEIHSGPQICDFCEHPVEFPNKKALRDHKRYKHSLQTNLKCDHCDKTYNSKA